MSLRQPPVAARAPLIRATRLPTILRVLQLGMWWGGSRFGGLDRVFESLVTNLPAQGVDVLALVEGNHDPHTRTAAVIREYAAAPTRAPKPLRVRRGIGTALRSDHPDLVACHLAQYAFFALDRLRAQPFVTHFHGPWAAEGREEGDGALLHAAKHMVETAVYRSADRIIVLSEAFRKLVCTEYGVDPQRVRIVPGPVDVARFATPLSRAEARRQLGFPQDCPILIAVRRLGKRMGLDQLIAAMVDVRRRFPQARLYLAGAGKLRADLERQVGELGLTDAVTFLGFVPDADLPKLYRAADLNVVPTSALEGFGLVAAESLAAGTPALVTAVGGLPDVVRGLSADLIFAGLDQHAIAAKLVAVLGGTTVLPDENACRDYAVRSFAAAAIAARTAANYREVLER